MRNHSTKLYLFLAFWGIAGLIQSFFTELFHDEAYYWLYGEYLDFGYFHQPPMVALFIKAGYLLFQNELGVRLSTVFASVLTIWGIEKLLPHKDIKLFCWIILGIGLVHVGSFFIAPDIPLLLFVTSFFLLLKKYLEKDSWSTALLLSINIALLLYSKYHSLGIIGISTLANLTLLRRGSFWAIVACSILLFIPHIYWQYLNDFPSYHFHWIARMRGDWTIMETLEFIGGQILITGPIIGVILFYAASRYKTQDAFERTLKLNFIGIFTLFLLLTFRGRVEANWTASAFIPMIVLSHAFIYNRTTFRKWTIRLGQLSLMIFVIARVYLMVDFLPFKVPFKQEFHNWDKWAEQIKAYAGDAKVVFINSYQYPSKYSFYTGDFSHSLNNFSYGGSQFDLWNFEEDIQGEEVLMVTTYPMKWDTIHTATGKVNYVKRISNFRSYNFISIYPDINEIAGHVKQELNIDLILKNTSDIPVNFNEKPGEESFLSYQIMDGRNILTTKDLQALNGYEIKDSLRIPIRISLPDQEGEYLINFSIRNGELAPGKNGNFRVLKVSENQALNILGEVFREISSYTIDPSEYIEV